MIFPNTTTVIINTAWNPKQWAIAIVAIALLSVIAATQVWMISDSTSPPQPTVRSIERCSA